MGQRGGVRCLPVRLSRPPNWSALRLERGGVGTGRSCWLEGFIQFPPIERRQPATLQRWAGPRGTERGRGLPSVAVGPFAGMLRLAERSW